MFYRKCFQTWLCIVKVFLIWNLFVEDVRTLKLFKGNLPDPFIITRALNTFIGPIIKSAPVAKPVFRTITEKSINKCIREKVRKLRPLLQDDDVKNLEEKIFLDDKDDTTIIEFLPKTEDKNKETKDNLLKANIDKFKKIREKINDALTKESVSDKTKKIIIKTLDALVKKLLSSQCKWKRNLRAQVHEEPAKIAKKWNQGLQEMKNMISSVFNNNSNILRRKDDDPKFLDNIQMLFRSVSKDVDMISKKYKIQCEFVPKTQLYSSNSAENEVNALRNLNKPDDEDNNCQNVIICSNELIEFMRKFYANLNDTAVSVIRNYAEMYARDVVIENETERDAIVKLLNNISVNIEGSVKHIFINETNNIQLDKEKNVDANINILKNYVKNTILYTKANIRSVLKTELVAINKKTRVVLYQDLKGNVDVDLGNLEREIISKICNVFSLCNGSYGSRRVSSNNINKNDIFVQVELTFDDDVVGKNNLRLSTDIEHYKNMNNYALNQTSGFKGVTRTTHFYNNVTFVNKNLK